VHFQGVELWIGYRRESGRYGIKSKKIAETASNAEDVPVDCETQNILPNDLHGDAYADMCSRR
jgi:hypothetical protein